MDDTKKRTRLFWTLFSFNALSYVPGATFGAYIGVYYKSQGLDVFQIGLLSAAGTIIALFMQPFWGTISDRRGRYVQILRLALCGSAAGVLFYYGASAFWMFLICVGFYSVFNCAIGPIGDAVVVNAAYKNDFPFSSIRMGGTLAYAVVVILAGMFLKSHPSASFGITAAAWAAMLCMTFRLPGDVRRQRLERKASPWLIFRNKKILFILGYACTFQIVLGLYNSFLGIMVTDMGYDNATIGKLMCVSALSEVPVLLVINRLSKKIRTEYLLLLAGLFMTLRAWLPLTGSIAGIFAGQALQGLTYMIMYYTCVTFMNENLPEELHGTGQSLFYMVQSGLACMFSNVVGGFLGTRIGLSKAYFLYGLILLAVTLVSGGFLTIYFRRKKQLT